MQRRYITVDVFTDRAFGGNPLAVVLDTGGLSTAQMQAIASEFNYSETTFVLPPRDSAHDAQVRIFTVRSEIPFAGHPNVGTAFVLAAHRFRQEVHDVHFVCPTATRATRDMFELAMHQHQRTDLPLTLLFGHSHEALAAADLALVASGNAERLLGLAAKAKA